jgi:SAM-dependent methyltransferase
LTPTDLATRTATNERNTREWLEQQTVAGFVAVEDTTLAPAERRLFLPPGHADVLANPESGTYWGSNVRHSIGLTAQLREVLAAFRSGGGVFLDAYGADLREGMAAGSRDVSEWIVSTVLPAALPDVHARFQADPAARIADIGCGAGWMAIRLAQTYPNVRVGGFDLDAPSVELARRTVAEAGVAERVRVLRQDAGDSDLAGRYDLVVAVNCVHDAPQPVAILQTMRRLAGEDGAVLIIEPKAGEHFLDPANNPDVERSHYAFSVLHCLPVGMTGQPSAGTGTMMRPDILRGYAQEAGFREVVVLPVEDDWTSVFRLRG